MALRGTRTQGQGRWCVIRRFLAEGPHYTARSGEYSFVLCCTRTKYIYACLWHVEDHSVSTAEICARKRSLVVFSLLVPIFLDKLLLIVIWRVFYSCFFFRQRWFSCTWGGLIQRLWTRKCGMSWCQWIYRCWLPLAENPSVNPSEVNRWCIKKLILSLWSYNIIVCDNFKPQRSNGCAFFSWDYCIDNGLLKPYWMYLTCKASPSSCF